MTPRPSCSLVVTTYEWPEALRVVLESVRRQRVPPGEVLVADDGSGEPTRALLAGLQPGFPVPLVHVWQPHEGFRAGQVRNKAIARATGEYVVQIDGDMVLHPDFVADHLDAAAPGCFVGGSRVILGEEATRRALAGAVPDALGADVRNRLNGLRWPALGRLASALVRPTGLAAVRGCNLAYWRADFLAVNGYDEAYVGWGREDTDLVVRFQRLGLRRRFFKLRGVGFHLHHADNSRARLAANDGLLQQAVERTGARCAVGVSRHLE